MIGHLEDLPSGENLQADLCIIGGGAAGIAIAHEFLASGLKVVLCEGGGRKAEKRSQKLYEGVVDPPDSHEPPTQNRERRWGGSTTVWGGRLVPFDPIDFKKRTHVPLSGWPFGYEELHSYYDRATAYCEGGNAAYTAAEALPDGPAEMLAGLEGEILSTSGLERWSPPTDFGKTYGAALEKSRSIQVILHANCIGLGVSREMGKIDFVRLVSPSGRLFQIQAREVVLAAGALETTRLLLASNDVLKNGIGNETGWLGRCYMSHLQGGIARVKLFDPTRLVYQFERDSEGVFVRRRFSVRPEILEREEMLNVIGFFFRPDNYRNYFEDPIVSAVYSAKLALRLRRASGEKRKSIWREEKQRLYRHGMNLLKGAPTAAGDLGRLAWRRYFCRRRLPFILPRPSKHYHLVFSAEQAPNPESRLELDPGKQDALGLPQLRIRLRFKDQDLQSLVKFHALMAEELKRKNLGEMDFDPEHLQSYLEEKVRDFNSGAHHLGSTRMSSSPQEGVVDADCRVYGVGNLYVASSSVFPTGSHANPTLTIVALALRLADHLKRSILKDSSDSLP